MLDGRMLPEVPGLGNGAAGEINALAHLFYDLTGQIELGPKDNSALTNGAPCASALVADAALVAKKRLALSHQVFALSIDAFKAPLEHYDPVLGTCWGNPHDKVALQGLAPYLRGAATDRRNFQAPVSFRILPRILGQAHQALEQAEATGGLVALFHYGTIRRTYRREQQGYRRRSILTAGFSIRVVFTMPALTPRWMRSRALRRTWC